MNHATILNQPTSIIHPLVFKRGLSLKTFWILAFISILTLLVFYVFQVNALTQEIYSIQSYEKKLSQLSIADETLKINFSKADSLENIESYLQAQNFEKVSQGQVRYIQILESQVAASQ